MLYNILVLLFVILCLFLIFLVLLQKSKSSMGLGSLGGGAQMLFGGSGGQDFFQKSTWILGVIFMAGSLILAMMNRPSSDFMERLGKYRSTEQTSEPFQEI